MHVALDGGAPVKPGLEDFSFAYHHYLIIMFISFSRVDQVVDEREVVQVG